MAGARRTISYDGTSLQSSTYQTQEIEHESMDNKLLNEQRFGNRDGAKVVDISFAARRITLRGMIKAADIDTLEANIDSLLQLMNKGKKNLDIQYASGTRRYNAHCRSVKIVRRHFHLTFAPFEAEFMVGDPPFGSTLDTATAEFTGVGTSFGTYNGTFVAQGTRRPMPIIKLNVNGGSGVTKIAFTNTTTGGSITVEPVGGFFAGDVLLINTNDYTVTLNGVAVDYTGFFPEFAQGGNDFKRVVWSTWHSVETKIIYYPLYL